MANLSVHFAHGTVALTAFMWSARNHEFTACPALSLALTDGPLISNSPLMVSETGLAPKMSVAVRTGDSYPCRYTWRTLQAAATCLATCVCQVAGIPFNARFTHTVWPWLLSGSLSHDNAG